MQQDRENKRMEEDQMQHMRRDNDHNDYESKIGHGEHYNHKGHRFEISVGSDCSLSLKQCVGLGYAEKDCKEWGCNGDYCLTGMIQQSHQPRHEVAGIKWLDDCARKGQEEKKSYLYGNGACYLYNSMIDLDNVSIVGGALWTVCTSVYETESAIAGIKSSKAKKHMPNGVDLVDSVSAKSMDISIGILAVIGAASMLYYIYKAVNGCLLKRYEFTQIKDVEY